jgi:hypothetical protein
MATTWTCASGHTHDVSKPAWQNVLSAGTGLDIECRNSGDRIVDWTPTASDGGRNAISAPHKKFVASSRGISDI